MSTNDPQLAPARLEPAESVALTIALAQLLSNSPIDPSVSVMCILGLARLAGREDWTEDVESQP